MRRLIMIAIIAVLAACRGEPVPPDFQNKPPAATHPPQSKSETPTQHGGGQPTPEPTSGVEGISAPYQPIDPTDTTASTAATLEKAPPVTKTTT